MQTKLLFLVFILFFQFNTYAQKYGTYSHTEKVYKVTIIDPGISAEAPLGRSTTIYSRIGLTPTIAADYDNEISGVLIRPFVSLSFRNYYNFQKRELMEKNIRKNSGNYFALLSMIAGQPLNKSKNYDYRLFDTRIANVGVVWGMQRNYSSRFSLDLNIGIGYAGIGRNRGISPIGEFNLGIWLGKRNNNQTSDNN